ncbi:class I SAM-dependent methyltransferase [Rubripirellula reticaptiva]|uniref:Bifunctional 3-demethylubiquinone-9 3-methyltransferase/ 2-octaprenyl-6-hydroxy phenol methylase n=1 Tax=Rubripirellula reticaptiva TaxID=2528013 RepID=A0A5C6F3X1_9BACT|nr:class I SAM-dependent methyltransferase [Rubripirellula reticaptiva]TWU55220.1 hypothetical protein Poly59_15170 [Rubripirellula reticaptiva]
MQEMIQEALDVNHDESMTTAKVEFCPGCSSSHFQPDGPAGSSFKVRVGNESFGQPSYEAMRCKECGLVFKSQVLNASSLDRYYRVVDFSKWEIEGLFPNERLVLGHLKNAKSGSLVLDIGCSSGRLLSRVTDKLECYGIEINPASAEKAAAKGITMVEPGSLSMSNFTEKFSVVVLVDVFEHLGNPKGLLSEAANSLSRDGELIICTGDADSTPMVRNLANSWYFRNVEHLVMMTRRYADYLADALGLDLVSYEPCSHYDTPFPDRMRQTLQRFAYCQFSNKTFLSRTVLRFIPYLRRAKNWTELPAYTCGQDHVIVRFRKQ